MSSTAIVLRLLTEQDELNRTHGRLAFGVLLFQDLAIVPLLALAGVLASPQDQYTTPEIALAVGKAAVALIIAIAAIVTPSTPLVTLEELNSRYGARASLDPAFGPAKVVVPDLGDILE